MLSLYLKRVISKNTLRYIFVIFSLLAALSARSADRTFSREFIGTDLTRGRTPLCALRDSYGFLWVGTHSGLSCYDGNLNSVYEATGGVVRSTEGMSVGALFAMGDDILFGGNPGLCVFSRAENTSRPFPLRTRYGVPVSSPVQKIIDGGDGNVWIFTRGQGFFIFDTNDSTLVQNSRHGAFFNDAIRGADGRVYATDINGCLNIFASNGHFISSVTLPDYKADKNPIALTQAGKEIWVSSNNKIYSYNPSTGSISLAVARESGSEINSMATSIHGNVLIGANDGIWLFDVANHTTSHLDFTDTGNGAAESDTRVTALTRDTDNAMLVVTPSGVTRLLGRDPEITHVKLSDGHGAPVRVTALCRQPLSGEKVWIGTSSGLMTYDPADGTVQHNVVPALAGIMVTSLTADGGDLWIGTRHHGLWRYTLSTGHIRRYVYDQSMPYAVISNDINDVYRTRSGEVFVLTDWGLCKYSPAKDNFYTLPEIGSHTPFVTMREDKQGRLWAATSSDGIYRRESANQAFQAGHGRSIGKRPVSILYLDSRDTLWAAQGSRVYRFNAQTDDFEQLSVPMTRDYPVVFLQEDNEQNMWIGTFGGLVKVTPDGATSYYAFHSPSAGITLPASSAAALLPDGKIAFGAGDELCVVNPRDMKSSTQRVNAYVQGISFPYFEDSQAEVERLGLDALLYTRKEIRLSYADNTFTLHLAASRYGEMPRVRFDYQLEGVDKGWIRDAGPEATYTDLRPGTYTFRVMANFGSDAPVSEIRIVILPPWYLTTWAYVAYVLLGLLLIVGVSVLYRRRLKLNYQHHLNELRVQKEQETFESKMRFFVNLVHEIRTPLTLINIPLEQMADGLAGGIDADNLDVDKARRHISSMQRNVSYLLGITNQLLDFRKAEQDSEVKLNYRRVDVSALLREIVDRFHHPMHEAGKEITLTLPQEPVYAVIDTDKTDRVVMNLIGNAMKYSRHTVSVTLEAPVDGTFTISVADDGPGIPQAERKHIFDTYYQIGNDNVAASLGTGLGLAYAKLIAKSHGGNIRVRNAAESGGAVFVLTLPVGDESKISAHSELISREEAAPAVPAPAPGAPDDARDTRSRRHRRRAHHAAHCRRQQRTALGHDRGPRQVVRHRHSHRRRGRPAGARRASRDRHHSERLHDAAHGRRRTGAPRQVRPRAVVYPVHNPHGQKRPRRPHGGDRKRCRRVCGEAFLHPSAACADREHTPHPRALPQPPHLGFRHFVGHRDRRQSGRAAAQPHRCRIFRYAQRIHPREHLRRGIFHRSACQADEYEPLELLPQNQGHHRSHSGGLSEEFPPRLLRPPACGRHESDRGGYPVGIHLLILLRQVLQGQIRHDPEGICRQSAGEQQ